MKKRKKLAQWIDTGNAQTNMYSVSQRNLRIVFDVICVLIFVCAARLMLQSVFGVGGISVRGVVSGLLVAAVVSGFMEFVEWDVRFEGRRKKTKVIFLIGGIVLSLIYLFFFKIGDKTIVGMQEFLGDYLQKWNVYYGSNMKLPKVKGGSVELGVDFMLIVLVFVVLMLTKLLGRKLILILIPLVTIILEVTVGYAPGKLGVIVMFVGVGLANILESERTEFKVPGLKRNESNSSKNWVYAIGISVVIAITGLTASKLVEKPVKNMMKYSDSVKELQRRMLEDFSLSQLLGDIADMFWSGNEDGEVISNARLKFKGEPVMELYLSDIPREPMYLKEFYGSRYVGSRWLSEDNDFEEAAEKAGFNVKEIKENIANMGVMSIANRMKINGLPVTAYTIQGTLKYFKDKDTRAFVPYFSEVTSDKVRIEGDSYFTKPKKDKTIEYDIWWVGENYGLDPEVYISGEKEDWEIWYESYVQENYLQVPSGMTNIKDYAELIRSANALPNVNGLTDENEDRLLIANAVADWFAENVTYTLNPPALPRNVDPVEYFVGVSKEGYCMHYASAATLILRELGVPARYASGYHVALSIFEESGDGFKGKIIDNTAHAWVEIYLERIGWVPFEVTTSYRESSENNPNIESDNDDNGQSGNDSSTDENETKPNGDGEKPNETESKDNDSEKPSSETNTSNGQKPTNSSGIANGDETGKGPGYYGTANDDLKESIVGKVLLISAFALLIGVAIYFAVAMKVRKEKKLQIMIQRKRIARVVRTINRELYNGLKKKGKLIGSKSGDEAYKEALVKTYTQVTEEEWERYMDIVKEMAFSENTGNVEDMEYCCEIYKRVKK